LLYVLGNLRNAHGFYDWRAALALGKTVRFIFAGIDPPKLLTVSVLNCDHIVVVTTAFVFDKGRPASLRLAARFCHDSALR